MCRDTKVITLDDYDDESESDLEDIDVRRPKPKHDPPVVSNTYFT